MASNNATQQFVPVKDIRDGVAIMKDGKMCSVLLASSINFALKSSDEQQAILSQFQAFLNTIEFSLQIYVQSRELDIEPYVEILRSLEPKQDNDLMRVQLREYIEFIQTFTSEVDIMSKSFFVVVPYTPSVGDIKTGISKFIGQKKEAPKLTGERFAEHKSQLEQRVAVVEQGLGRIGVRTIPLGNDELIELFYHIFNPTETKRAPTQSS